VIIFPEPQDDSPHDINNKYKKALQEAAVKTLRLVDNMAVIDFINPEERLRFF